MEDPSQEAGTDALLLLRSSRPPYLGLGLPYCCIERNEKAQFKEEQPSVFGAVLRAAGAAALLRNRLAQDIDNRLECEKVGDLLACGVGTRTDGIDTELQQSRDAKTELHVKQWIASSQ